MAYTLGNKCAKNLCKRIVLLQLIIENVVTCFFGTQCRFFSNISLVTVAAVLQCETDQARSRTIHNHSRPRIVCMTARLDVTPKTTEQNRIVRTGKPETEVTYKKILRSRYCTIEATKLTTDRHEASRGLFATAELLVNAKLMLHRLITIDNRIPVPATYIGTIAQYTVQAVQKNNAVLCQMVLIALIFGPNLPLLFKLQNIWSVDSPANH